MGVVINKWSIGIVVIGLLAVYSYYFPITTYLEPNLPSFKTPPTQLAKPTTTNSPLLTPTKPLVTIPLEPLKPAQLIPIIELPSSWKDKIMPKSKDIKFNNGLRFDFTSPTVIESPIKGKVIYANQYGNYKGLVIIEINDDYQLLVSGLSELNVKTGQMLNINDKLGIIYFKKSTLYGILNNKQQTNHFVYLELRYKLMTVDPQEWFIHYR